MTELPDALHEEIQRLSALGDELAEQGNYQAAIEQYNEAWRLVPEPRSDWEASTWLLAAIGDSCFLAGQFKSGGDAFRYALTCPGGLGNPFIHLRLGQCALEEEHRDEAAEHLARAYMLEGAEILADDDSKYFEFLKTRLKPPASGQW